jgi:TetR/AcrR family transcriptional regulator, transcriptional repressor for nem operon
LPLKFRTMSQDRSNTQTRILEAAQQLMLREGFHSVSVDRIIAAAGVSKGTFFYHFPTKDALPSALLRLFIQRQGEQIQASFAATAREADPLVRALAVIRGLAPLFTRCFQGAPGCVMAAFSYQLTQDFPGLQAISQEAVAGWRRAFGNLLQPLCGEPARAEALAEHLLCCLQGASVVARVHGDAAVVQRALDEFCRYLACQFAVAPGETSEKPTSAYTCATPPTP